MKSFASLRMTIVGSASIRTMLVLRSDPGTLLSRLLEGCVGWLAGRFSGRACTDAQIDGPEIGDNLPVSGWLTSHHQQVFAAFFAALAHSDRDQHFAAAEVECDLAKNLGAQALHF